MRNTTEKTGGIDYEFIRSRRNELKLSQVDFAQKVAISQPSVCKIEAGKRSIPTKHLQSFARVLGVTVDQLFVSTN